MKKPGLLSAAGVCVLVLLPKVAHADEVPDPHLTPGSIASADTAEVCASDGRPGSAYSRAHRSMNENDRRSDFARYRIAWRDHRGYEDDHLVPLCLGGADAPANRWPEPGSGIWNYHEKDRLEGYACQMVCSGRIGLGTAQRWFLAPSDWRAAYRRVFGVPR
jgi:hypothetical protein